MYYKLNEEMINRKYTIKLCSIEKKYIYYRDNFTRLCIDNHKLQKENEELEKQRDKLFIKDFEFLKENYISKDKIKAKIKELEEQHDIEKDMYKRLDIEAQIEVLKELLGGDIE